MDDPTLRAIRILALNSVENPSWETSYRKICRWYSREFSTPLKDVEDLPEYSVLLTYFEDKYQEMASSSVEEIKKAYEEIKESLIIGEEIIKKELEDASIEDEAWAQKMAEEIKHEQEKDKQKQSDNIEEPNLIDIEDRFELNGEDQHFDQE